MCFSSLTGMYGLPRPWYFPLQRSYWSGSGRSETWDWPWCGGSSARLSVMEEDQACAMDQRKTGTDNWSFSIYHRPCIAYMQIFFFCINTLSSYSNLLFNFWLKTFLFISQLLTHRGVNLWQTLYSLILRSPILFKMDSWFKTYLYYRMCKCCPCSWVPPFSLHQDHHINFEKIDFLCCELCKLIPNHRRSLFLFEAIFTPPILASQICLFALPSESCSWLAYLSANTENRAKQFIKG